MPTKTSRATSDPEFLARVYQFERDRLVRGPLVQGGGYSLPAVWRPDRPIWKKLVASTAASGIDPVRYIRWCMSNPRAMLPPEVPEPNQLLERSRVEDYASDMTGVCREIESRFKSEREVASRHMTVKQRCFGHPPEFVQISVLSDGEHLQLSPLFCYAVARSSRFPKVLRLASRLEADAMFQFSRDPDENAEVYGAGGFLPTGFAAKAAEFYAILVDGFAGRVAREVGA